MGDEFVEGAAQSERRESEGESRNPSGCDVEGGPGVEEGGCVSCGEVPGP